VDEGREVSRRVTVLTKAKEWGLLFVIIPLWLMPKKTFRKNILLWKK
jgi:hypothetical protein